MSASQFEISSGSTEFATRIRWGADVLHREEETHPIVFWRACPLEVRALQSVDVADRDVLGCV